MASGDDPLIPFHDPQGSGENTVLKDVGSLESLREEHHFEKQLDSYKNVVEAVEVVETTSKLYELPPRVRMHIWNHLDWLGLQAVHQTCSKFQLEVFKTPLYQTNIEAQELPFENFMQILPFIPLRDYLDSATRDILRLVCSRLKTIMDLYDDMDGSCRRWGSKANFYSCGFPNICGSTLNTESHQVQSNKKLHIFDVPVHDLKRIFSLLEERDLNSLETVSVAFKRIVEELSAHPFIEFQENFSLQLMDLPFEVHEKILHFCNPNDRQRLRLVSKLMQFQVDTLAGVEVHLNDLKWGWNRCGKLPPAYSLVVTNVDNIQSVNYFTSEDNCMLLTRIVLDGKFPAKAMILVLERCKNLQYVGFTHALQMSSIEDELQKAFPIKKKSMELLSLKALNLKIQETEFPSNNIFRVHSWTWANAFEFMKSSLFYIPKLTSFYICEEAIITHNLMHEVAEKVLKFIIEHRHSLKYVSVILTGNCLRTCGCPTFPFKIPENVLQEIKLAKFCHDCDWRISRPFASILSMQQNLKELTCFELSDWEFYAGVIFQNKLSLRSVTIEKNLAPVIDLSAFSSCTNLERLWISQHSSTKLTQQNCNHLQTIRVDQRLTNLNALPTNITHLHILDQTVDASQIETIPQRLKKLQVLDLQFLGSWDGKSFGMSTETVKDMLHLRELKCLFLEEIRTLDAYMQDTLEIALSGINLIPIQYSQQIKSVGCIVYGILIAEGLPNVDFMPEWKSRVSCYFDNVVPFFEGFDNFGFNHDEEYYEEMFRQDDNEDEDEESSEEVLEEQGEGVDSSNDN